MSCKKLENKTALITGAAQGIGRATTLLYAQNGAKVLACDINEEALYKLREECPCEIHLLDVREEEQIKTLASSLDKLEILFNCAGFVHNGTILECEEDDWERSMDLNLKAMYKMIKYFLPAMIAAQGASIINMSSVASSIKGVANRFVYGVTKAAVIGLSKSIATDFISQGIRCNAICPGTVDTPSLDKRLYATGDYREAKANFIARQPMGRMGRASEIAEYALYLASDASAFTTGTTQIIDGGWTN